MKKLLAIAFGAMVFAGGSQAQQADTLVLPMTYHGTSERIFDIGLRKRILSAEVMVPATEMVQKHGPLLTEYEAPVASLQSALSTPSVQTTSAPASAIPYVSFEGPGKGMAGYTVTAAPPDTTLAVGPNHIIAWVNSNYVVYDKAGNLLSTPLAGNTPFTGTGNLCQSTNRGDPILQYDRRADRWILSQFAFAVDGLGNPIAPYLQCIAVSQSNNPLGAYHRYSIQFSPVAPSGFNDYGKLGIFGDAYYTSYNVFQGSPAGGNSGSAMCASDRTKMLAGDPTATTLCAPIAFYAGGAALLPADVDGTTTPTTTAQGNIFMRQSTAGALRMLKLNPNFAAGTVTLNDGFGGATGSFVNLNVGAVLRACNGSAGACIRQPTTTTVLDTLGDRLMYRLVYRNRGGVDSLMVVQSVDPDGAGARGSAVRWYEIRNPFAATPTVFQNSTFDPGSTGDRWMGSIAMDKNGNMLMGYSMADVTTNTFPSIAVAGRLRSDMRNTMRTEQVAWAGTGAQTVRTNGTALTRWGDYTTMQVDPVDDCTFWFIGQYIPTNGVFNWGTRIVSYKFPGCN